MNAFFQYLGIRLLDMKTILTYLLCFTIMCNVKSQEVSKALKMNHISMYKDFTIRGYTTAGAYTHFDDMKDKGVLQININDKDLSMIEEIIKRAEQKKHRQQKFGTQNLFCEVQYANRATPNRLIISGVGTVYNFFGKSKGESASISDLTSMEEYVIKDSDDLEWVASFQERIRLQ